MAASGVRHERDADDALFALVLVQRRVPPNSSGVALAFLRVVAAGHAPAAAEAVQAILTGSRVQCERKDWRQAQHDTAPDTNIGISAFMAFEAFKNTQHRHNGELGLLSWP